MSNGNGNKTIILNTRERVLSTDANRAQTFYGQGMADLLRFMLDASSEESRLGGGYEVLSDGTESPLRAYIVNGIRPQPVNGTTSLLISPGVICIVDNPSDPNTDNSVASWITDPGIQLTGVLTLPVNASGSTIIGVIECQRSLVVMEQDNRDIFNTTTGLFTPALVNKVAAGALTYRIRLGTPGAGYPGIAAGWIPLAVFNQPSAATTWDDVLLMWDVRTMINDRWNAPFNTPLSQSEITKTYGYTDILTVGQRRLRTETDVNYLANRAGGQLGLTDPAAAGVGYFDLLLAANRTANFAGFSSNSWYYIYAIFPFGLPRWQLFSSVAGAAPRRPCGPRGIPAITNVGPLFTGVPSSVISAPSATGLLDTPALTAVCMVAGQTNTVPAPLPVAQDGRTTFRGNATSFNVAGVDTSPDYTLWTLDDNVTHPGNARALIVSLFATFTASAGGRLAIFGNVHVTGPDADINCIYATHDEGIKEFEVAAGAYRHGIVARIPLAPAAPMTAVRQFLLQWNYSALVSAGTVTVTGSQLRVFGWELGP